MASAQPSQRDWTLPSDCLFVTTLSCGADLARLFQPAIETAQAALRCPDLWQEAALLRRLLYKNSGQHHGSLHMRRLRHVSRLLAALQGADAAGALGDLQAMTHLAGSSTSIATGAGAASTASRSAHQVPCQEAALACMARVLAAGLLLEQLVGACVEAAAQLAAQVARSFFMPLCVTGLAMLARVQALGGQQLHACASAYNALADLAPLLPTAAPPHPPSAASPPAPPFRSLPSAAAATLVPSAPCAMPQAVACVVAGGLPRLVAAEGDGGGSQQVGGMSGQQQHWLARRAAELWDELGLMQGLEVTYVGPAAADAPPAAADPAAATAAAAEGPGGADGAASARVEDGRGSVEGAAAAQRQQRAGRRVAGAPGRGTQGTATLASSFYGQLKAAPTTSAPSSNRQHQPPPATAAAVHAFLDRGRSKRPPSATATTTTEGAVAAPQAAAEDATTAAAAAAPVYTTAVLPGFGLGLGGAQPPPWPPPGAAAAATATQAAAPPAAQGVGVLTVAATLPEPSAAHPTEAPLAGPGAQPRDRAPERPGRRAMLGGPAAAPAQRAGDATQPAFVKVAVGGGGGAAAQASSASGAAERSSSAPALGAPPAGRKRDASAPTGAASMSGEKNKKKQKKGKQQQEEEEGQGGRGGAGGKQRSWEDLLML